MGLVGDDEKIIPRIDRLCNILKAELVDEGEYKPVILSEKLLQMPDTVCFGIFVCGDPTPGEPITYLFVQLVAIGDDHKREIAGEFAEYLRTEKHHRKALPAPLRMPEDSYFPAIFLTILEVFDSFVDAEILMILGEDFDHLAMRVVEEYEIFDNIQKSRRLTDTTDHRFEIRLHGLVLAGYFLPLCKVLESARDRAYLALDTIADDDTRIVPKNLRYRVTIVAEIVVVRIVDALGRDLELDEEERDAIDEADDIRSSFVEVAEYGHLRHDQEVIIRRGVPVDDPHRPHIGSAIIIRDGDLHAIAEQGVDFTIRIDEAAGGAIRSDRVDRTVESVCRQVGIEADECGAETVGEDDIGGIPSSEPTLSLLAHRTDMSIISPYPTKYIDRRLLHEGVLRKKSGHKGYEKGYNLYRYIETLHIELTTNESREEEVSAIFQDIILSM